MLEKYIPSRVPWVIILTFYPYTFVNDIFSMIQWIEIAEL
jgi:hypothetical protein